MPVVNGIRQVYKDLSVRAFDADKSSFAASKNLL
jgi:hypothetical protein